MKRSIIATITGILFSIIAALVVIIAMMQSPDPVYAVEATSLTVWEESLLDYVNTIRAENDLAELEWSYAHAGVEPVVTTTHSGSVYSSDELFTKYLVSYWFNQDNSIILNKNAKYLYADISLDGDVLTASLYYPTEDEEAADDVVIPEISEGNTGNYNMEEVIAAKRPVVETPDETSANPVFDSTQIVIPSYGLDNIYNYSMYAKASDTGKIILIHTDFCREEGAAENEILVTAVNNTGFATSEKMTVAYEETEYYTASTSDPRPSCLTTNEDGSVMQYGHVILNTDEAEVANAKYVFEIVSPDGTTSKVIRNKNGMIWNPTSHGTYSISIYTIYNSKGIQSISEMQTFTLQVAEYVSGVIEIKPPVLTFAQGTTYIKDDEVFTISGVMPGTTVTQFTQAIIIENGNDNIVLTIPDKTEESNIGTGTIVRIESANGEKIYCTYTILCYGDINGDGLIGIADFSKLRAYLLSKTELEGVFATCADINFDGTIGIADFSKLRAALLGKTVIEQDRKAEISGE